LRKLELEQTREMWVVADYPDSAREAMPEPEIVMGLGACCTCGHQEGTLLTRTLLTHFRLRLRSRNFRRQVCKRE